MTRCWQWLTNTLITACNTRLGEFSSDVPVNPTTPKVLYVKLLKNQLIKTNLPTWNLMMKNIYPLNASQISPKGFQAEDLQAG